MAIPLSVYNSVITSDRRKRFGNTPDRLCALLAMLSAGEYAWANKSIYKQAPSFVYEQGGLYSAEVRRAHDYFTTRSPTDFYSLSTLTFAPKGKGFPELQAADYLAFNISERASHVVDPHPPLGAQLEIMPDGKTVRRMRYPLQALYSERGGEVRYSPTADVLEKIMTALEQNNYCRVSSSITKTPHVHYCLPEARLERGGSIRLYPWFSGSEGRLCKGERLTAEADLRKAVQLFQCSLIESTRCSSHGVAFLVSTIS